MKITQFTDFSLRLLLYLMRNPGRVVAVREIAAFYDISAEHLKKVVRHLVANGHIITVRGKHGGLKLGRVPAEISLGRLFRESENLSLMPCHDGGRSCQVEHCKVNTVVERGLAAFLAELDAVTLSDMA